MDKQTVKRFIVRNAYYSKAGVGRKLLKKVFDISDSTAGRVLDETVSLYSDILKKESGRVVFFGGRKELPLKDRYQTINLLISEGEPFSVTGVDQEAILEGDLDNHRDIDYLYGCKDASLLFDVDSYSNKVFLINDSLNIVPIGVADAHSLDVLIFVQDPETSKWHKSEIGASSLQTVELTDIEVPDSITEYAGTSLIQLELEPDEIASLHTAMKLVGLNPNDSADIDAFINNALTMKLNDEGINGAVKDIALGHTRMAEGALMKELRIELTLGNVDKVTSLVHSLSQAMIDEAIRQRDDTSESAMRAKNLMGSLRDMF